MYRVNVMGIFWDNVSRKYRINRNTLKKFRRKCVFFQQHSYPEQTKERSVKKLTSTVIHTRICH